MPLSEFELIQQYFAHQAIEREDIILGVGDDAALIQPPADSELVIAIDTLVQGVHFPTDTAADDIGYKVLAVNLSDLAAMGAEPAWFTLALTLPESSETWLQAFTQGLFAVANSFKLQLVGGDTTRGALTVSIQIAGYLPQGMAIQRKGAGIGDKIYVTGTLGDANLGLQLVQGSVSAPAEACQALIARLNRPTPRVAEGIALRQVASAAIDISDGLMADMTHLLEASQVGANIYLQQLPLSAPAKALLNTHPQLMDAILTGGDDYELCFTVPQNKVPKLEQVFAKRDCSLSCIGEITEARSLRCFDEQGRIVQLKQAGYQHF